jgi:hypothetical protein
MTKLLLLEEALQKVCGPNLSPENRTIITDWYANNPLSFTVSALPKEINSLLNSHTKEVLKELERIGFWSEEISEHKK